MGPSARSLPTGCSLGRCGLSGEWATQSLPPGTKAPVAAAGLMRTLWKLSGQGRCPGRSPGSVLHLPGNICLVAPLRTMKTYLGTVFFQCNAIFFQNERK